MPIVGETAEANTAVEDEAVLPAELVAVTVALIKLPMSAATRVYELDVAPEIVE